MLRLHQPITQAVVLRYKDGVPVRLMLMEPLFSHLNSYRRGICRGTVGGDGLVVDCYNGMQIIYFCYTKLDIHKRCSSNDIST